MAEAGLQEVETYISHRHNRFAQFIVARPIMELFLAAEQRLGPRVSKQWWEHNGVDVKGVWMVGWEVKWVEEDENTDGTKTETD